MADDIVERLRARLPELIKSAIARLEQRAASGDAIAAARLADAGSTLVPSLLKVAGESGGELWFLAARSGLTPCEQPPANAASGFGHALELPVAAVRQALVVADRSTADVDEVVSALALIASANARAILGASSFCFDLDVLRVPVIGTMRVRIGFGRPLLAGKPEFALRVESDELEDAREEGIGPHQLFLAGKVKIDGDVARAMQLAMVLAQL
jgi:hypothetical protein